MGGMGLESVGEGGSGDMGDDDYYMTMEVVAVVDGTRHDTTRHAVTGTGLLLAIDMVPGAEAGAVAAEFGRSCEQDESQQHQRGRMADGRSFARQVSRRN